MSKIIKLEDLKDSYFRDSCIIAVMGFFDGVHRGHKKIIKMCVERAKELEGLSLVFTFDKPPINIITGKLYKKLITTYEDKLDFIREQGVDFIIVSNFDRSFAEMEPYDFCEEILLKKVNIKELFIGTGFKFGKNAKGNTAILRDFFIKRGIGINEVPILKINGLDVSSTSIRDFYKKGDIENMRTFLGRYPYVKGKVVSGEKRGSTLGFPTANIDIFREFVIPDDGVYIGLVSIINGGTKLTDLNAIINIGDNPTFKNSHKRIESHILDFHDDIYNADIKVTFLKRLREEITFKKKEDLINQIKSDIEQARKYFKEIVY